MPDLDLDRTSHVKCEEFSIWRGSPALSSWNGMERTPFEKQFLKFSNCCLIKRPNSGVSSQGALQARSCRPASPRTPSSTTGISPDSESPSKECSLGTTGSSELSWTQVGELRMSTRGWRHACHQQVDCDKYQSEREVILLDRKGLTTQSLSIPKSALAC